jgi:hypothetical protein
MKQQQLSRQLLPQVSAARSSASSEPPGQCLWHLPIAQWVTDMHDASIIRVALHCAWHHHVVKAYCCFCALAGNVKAANIEIHSSLHRPAVSSNSSSTAPRRRSAAGALQMPGQTQ